MRSTKGQRCRQLGKRVACGTEKVPQSLWPLNPSEQLLGFLKPCSLVWITTVIHHGGLSPGAGVDLSANSKRQRQLLFPRVPKVQTQCHLLLFPNHSLVKVKLNSETLRPRKK